MSQRLLKQVGVTTAIAHDFGLALKALEDKVMLEFGVALKALEEKTMETIVNMRGAKIKPPEFDDRRLKVKAYCGDKSIWRDYEYAPTGFVGRESQTLKEAMINVVDMEHEANAEIIKWLGVDTELDGKLLWLKQNKVEAESKASTMVRALKNRLGLEVWRKMSRDAKLGGSTRNLGHRRPYASSPCTPLQGVREEHLGVGREAGRGGLQIDLGRGLIGAMQGDGAVIHDADGVEE